MAGNGITPGSRPTRYRLLGRIVAPRLPEGLLGEEILIRRTDGADRTARPTHLKSMPQKASGGFLSASPSEVLVVSDAIIEVRVRAKSREHAVEVAKERHLRPLTAALMSLTAGVVHVELAKVDPEDEQGDVINSGTSVWSDRAVMANIGPMPTMEDEEINQLAALMNMVRRDRVAKSAATDLVAASTMTWTAGGREAEQAAATLRHFLVIERIASRVAGRRTRDAPDNSTVRRVIESLRQDLNGTPEFATGRILNAARELEKQQRRRLAADIEFTCEDLSISNDTRDTALNLNKLRNQALAHPGRPLERHRLATSTAESQAIATAFMAAYLKSARK